MSYQHPGVYVREVPSGARSIEGADTSTAIFVGETERGPIGPTKIKGIVDYERLFGGHRRWTGPTNRAKRVLMRDAIAGFFNNGGKSAYVLRAMDNWEDAIAPSTAKVERTLPTNFTVRAASPGIWADGRVAVVLAPSSDVSAARFRLLVFYLEPLYGTTTTHWKLVEDWDRLSLDTSDDNYVVDTLQRSAFVRYVGTASAIPTPDAITTATPFDLGTVVAAFKASPAAYLLATTAPTDNEGDGQVLASTGLLDLMNKQLAEVDDAALLVAATARMHKDAVTAAADFSDAIFQGVVQTFAKYAENRPRQDLFYVADVFPYSGEASTTEAVNDAVAIYTDTTSGLQGLSNFAAAYWPHVRIEDSIGAGRNPTVTVPAAGFVAGIYARTDGRRGVWKTAAGTDASIAGIVGLEYNVLDSHQDDMNPKGLNALRSIRGTGTVVWGARTLQPTSEWRYIAVRRTAIFLRSSIYPSIQWAVFEPNDRPLWEALRTSIAAFMEIQFRNGAFAGRTSDAAYFVKCDSETTSEIDQAAGIVNVLVAFAPLRPAEFVVLSLTQKTATRS